MITEDQVRKALANVIDPELGYNIVDLGLIYNISIQKAGSVEILMTLTSPGCPLGEEIQRDMREKLSEIQDIGEIHISLTFSPPWSPAVASDELKEEFHFMGIPTE